VFGISDVTLIGTIPNGQRQILMARRMYPIASAVATLDGDGPGRPTTTETNTKPESVAYAARPILAIVETYFEILDHAEYDRTRSKLDETSVR
jgi:hypothetical protein